MFISVVIAAYNEEAYLGDCLAALAPDRQRYPADSYEVIVADNNSTDRTAEIARQHGARVVTVSEKGVAHARQGGARAAAGDIVRRQRDTIRRQRDTIRRQRDTIRQQRDTIRQQRDLLASTDADTTVSPDWLAVIAARFQADDGLVGLMGPVYLREGPGYARVYQGVVMNTWLRLFHALGRPCFPGQNFAVCRADFQAIGGYDTRMRTGEDINLSIRLRHRGRIAWEPHMRVYTSARRVTAGAWANLGQGFRDYLFIAILERGTGSEHRDIR